MRKIKTESPEAQDNPVSYKGSRTPLIVMGVIVLLAAFVRVAFSVGTSIDSGFALSGGSVSTNNLYILTELVANGAIVLADSSLYYPYGVSSTAPFVFTLLMYPFAALVNVFVSDATLASSAVLAFSGPVFAVAAVIASYFLGKQILKSKLAGYLTALFVALCPVFVKESVFSNGTGTSFVLFLLVLCIFFLFKAVETVGYKEGEEATRKKAYGFSAISGLLLALIALSWVSYRAVLLPILAVMVVHVLVDRFKGKDPMPMALVYSITVLIAAVAAGLYYGLLGLWDQVASGSVILAVFVSALVAGFAATAKKPWVLTLPIVVIVAAAALIALAFLMPDLFHSIVSGNPIYDDAYLATLGEQKLSLSMLSTYYGAITYWFVFLAVLGMICKFRANAGSAPYVFTMVWLLVLPITCGHSAVQAAVATPAFALGFAAVVCWILKHIDFGAYISAIKTAEGKLKIRKVLKPAPFLSIIVALLLVVGPNVTYVLDASISSNDVDGYNEGIGSVIDVEPFGALNYYIKTDESWKVRDALKDIAPSVNNGALVSWMDYSADAPLYAGLKSYTDSDGHGTVTASNILLANAVDGSASAAVLVNAIMFLGLTDAVKAKLTVEFGDAAVTVIGDVLADVDNNVGNKTVRYMVTTDVETYGKVATDISDENIKYLFLTNYLAENFSQYAINNAYDALADAEDLATPYIMVTGDMMPFYYGYAGVFNEMAKLNGYYVDSSSYYTVDKFTQFGYYAYYYGIYGFTDAMYDTLLYRTYIGMSPAEAGYASIYDYMMALSNADASVVMQPGYGLGNYSVVYWQVMYNADDDATSDSDGWVQMDGRAAIDKQKTEGGRINYLSGLPVIVKYDANATGSKIAGTVLNAKAGEVRISAFDADGNLRATTFTDADGKYTLYVRDPSTTALVFYAGSQGLTGGIVFDTVVIGANTTIDSNKFNKVNVTFNLDYVGTVNVQNDEFTATITNTLTEEVIDVVLGTPVSVMPGTYDVKVLSGETSVYTGTVTTSMAVNQTVDLSVDVYEYVITLKDEFKQVVTSGTIDVSGDLFTGSFTIVDGSCTLKVPKGTYSLSVDNYCLETSTVSISSNGSKSINVSKGKTIAVDAPAGVVVNFVNDVYRTSVLAGTGVKVTLPVSYFGNTAYTVSYMDGSNVKYAFVEDFAQISTMPTMVTSSGSKDVSGTLKNAAGTAVSGTVSLYADNGAMFRASAGSDGKFTVYGVPADKNLFVYATNGTSEAYMGELLAADSTIDSVNMVAADSIDPSISWSSVHAKYLNVAVTEIEGLSAYKLTFNVNTSGSYKVLIPTTLDAKITVALEGNMWFKAGSTATQTSVVILTDGSRTEPSYALCVRVDGNEAVDQNIKLSSGAGLGTYYLNVGGVTTVEAAVNTGFKASSSIPYTLGETATGTDTSGAYHANGTFYYNPFVDGFSISLEKLLGVASLADVEYKSVAISGLDSTDVVSIDGDYKAGNTGASTGKEYLLKTNTTEKTLITIKDATGAEVMYKNIDVSNSTPLSFDAATLNPVVKVKGFVGIIADGTLTVTYADGAAIEFDIEDGSYEATIYKSTNVDIKVSVTKDGVEFADSYVGVNLSADATENFVVSGAGTIEPVTGATISSGIYKSVSATIVLDDLNAGYFSIKFGEGWDSAYAMVGGDIVSKVYVGDSVVSVEIFGYYNSSMYDLASEEMLITFDGSSYDMHRYIQDAAAVDGGVYVNKLDDIVGGNAYIYALEVNNMAGQVIDVNIDVNVATGWNMLVEVEAFGTVYGVFDDLTSPFKAFPGVTTYRITFVPGTSPIGDVPDLGASFDFGTADVTVSTLTGDDVSVSGKVATVSAEPGSAVVDATDMNASGRGVFNDKGSTPTIVWVLFALAIILAILTVWMATKRGVFARRK